MFSLSIVNKKPKKGDVFKFNNKYIRLMQTYSLSHWDPYYCNKTNTQIIVLGRPVLDLSVWNKYTSDNKSFISKKLLSYYNNCNSVNDFCNKLNGGFIVVILDHKANKLIIVRDRLGIYPGYTNCTSNVNEFLFSTHSDMFTKERGADHLDKISIAEFIEQGFVSHPYTFYKDIQSMNNASYIELDFSSNFIFKESYFDFFDKEMIKSKSQAFQKLRSAIKNSIERRTHKHFGRSGVLLSGGGDSRVIVSSSLTKLRAFTVYRNKNYELDITKKVARKNKLEHTLICLDEINAIESLQESPKYTGGMVSGGTASWCDLIDSDYFINIDNLLTGDYADWLLKDISFNTEKVRIFGKQLPLNKFSKYHDSFYAPFVEISGLNIKTKERKSQKYKGIKENLTKLQIKRVIPLSNEYTSSSRLILQRFFPWDSPFSDNEVIEAVFSLPPRFKLNGVLYDKVLGDLCKDLSKIKHANKRVPLGSSIFRSLITQSFNILRSKILRNSYFCADIIGNKRNSSALNKEIVNIFHNTPNDVQRIIVDVCGVNIFALTLDELLQYDYHLVYHVITFSSWHQSHFED